MNKIITYCGYRCDICPAYFENLKNDQQKIDITQKWKKFFNIDLPVDLLPCSGCRGSKLTIDPDCPVRPCAIQKKLCTCANCADYDCNKMKTRSDFLKNIEFKMQNKEFSDQDYKQYVECFEGKDRLIKIKKS